MYTQGHTYNHTHVFLLSSDAALNCLFPFICFISNIRLNYIKLNRPHDRSTCYSAWCEKLAGSLLVVGDARPRLIIPRKKINKKVCEEHKKDCCSNREKKCWSRWEPLERGNEGTAFLCQAVDACCSYSTKQKKKSCSLQQNHSTWRKHTRCVTMLADPVVKEVHRPITKPPSHLLLIIFILFFYPPPVTHHHFLIRWCWKG